MTSLDTPKTLASTYLSELRDTAEIRGIFSDILIGRNGELRGFLSYDRNVVDRLDDAARLKTTGPAALYRGLIVQSVSVFENFVKELASATIALNVDRAGRYSSLSDKFRNQHAYHAGQILTHVNKGVLPGQKFGFPILMKNLGDCFSDQDSFDVMPEVFTLLMGNATPDRLENLFEKLDLPSPFSPGVGDTNAMKKALNETRKVPAAKLARGELESLIKKRNTIVHGDLSLDVQQSDFQNAVDFLEAMIEALHEVVSKQFV